MNISTANRRREAMTPAYRTLQALPSAEYMDSVLSDVTAAMAERDYPAQDRWAVRLMLEAAILNALKHGHRGDVSKLVCVSCLVDDREAAVAVQDQGSGFDPQTVPESCGGGLRLIRQYATTLHFNERGNGVSFFRRRSRAPNASERAEQRPSPAHAPGSSRCLVMRSSPFFRATCRVSWAVGELSSVLAIWRQAR
jgi:serine/threonine-protein kinase RsbW